MVKLFIVWVLIAVVGGMLDRFYLKRKKLLTSK